MISARLIERHQDRCRGQLDEDDYHGGMLRLALLAVASLAQDPPAADPPCALLGRLVDEAGAPLAGVTLSVQGRQASADRVRRFGLPASWTDPAPVETDAEGNFRVSFVPPRAFQFSLAARPAGRGGVRWHWDELQPGAELDLGTTTLSPEALIVGYIVDGAGQLLTDGWIVSAQHHSSSGTNGRSGVGVLAHVEPASGEFRIAGLPPGRIRLEASAGSVRIPERWFDTKAGEVTEVELRYDGPDPRRKLVVSITAGPPYLPFKPALGTVHAVGADGERIALAPEPGRANDWQALGVRPGAYRVEIRDPRFLDWTQEGVVPGQAARARLEGSAALVVRVVEADSGAAVQDYSLDLVYRNVDFSSGEVRLREAGAGALPEGRYTGIVPGDLELVVRAAGWPSRALAVDALAPGETRAVEVRLVKATSLRGRLVDHAGQPLGGVEVQVTRGSVPGHDDAGGGTRRGVRHADGASVMIQMPYRDAATETAADGTFQFTGLGSGLHTVYATFGPVLEASAQVTLPTEQTVELTAPEVVPVVVRMVLPDGMAPTRFGLSPSFPLPGTFGPLRHIREFDVTHRLWRADAEGRCEMALLPPGRHAFSVVRAIADTFEHGFTGVLRVELEIERDGELALDLRDRFPVRVTLTADVPEAPAAYVSWQLMRRDPVEFVNFRRRRTQAGRSPLLEAEASPGVYTLRAVGSGFEWTAPKPVTVAPDAKNELQATLPLIARNVRVVDGEGVPRAHTHIVYWATTGVPGSSVTDAAGECTLAFLAGDAFFAPAPAPSPGEAQESHDPFEALVPAAQLTWSSGSGPLTVSF